MSLDLTLEEHQLLNAPLKKKETNAQHNPLTQYGLLPDKIPPIKFPKKPWRQEQL